jgi:endonuclease YncB( thermonuclease family)
VSIVLAAFLCAGAVVVDGDTLRCRDLGRVRLIGIDAPELPGHCNPGRRCTPGDGFASKAALERTIGGRAVSCEGEGRDRYGRVLARCAAGGVDLGCAQVAIGQAVVRYGDPRCGRE